jgi:hypothetical protein
MLSTYKPELVELLEILTVWFPEINGVDIVGEIMPVEIYVELG